MTCTEGGRGGGGARRQRLAGWLACFLSDSGKGGNGPWEGIWELTAWAERGREVGGIGESGRAEPGAGEIPASMICRVWAARKWPAGRQQQQQQQQQVEIREPGPWSWFTVARSGRGVKRLAAARCFGTGRCYSLLLKGEEPGESRNEWRLVCIQLRGLVAGVFVCLPNVSQIELQRNYYRRPSSEQSLARTASPASPASTACDPAHPHAQHWERHNLEYSTC